MFSFVCHSYLNRLLQSSLHSTKGLCCLAAWKLSKHCIGMQYLRDLVSYRANDLVGLVRLHKRSVALKCSDLSLCCNRWIKNGQWKTVVSQFVSCGHVTAGYQSVRCLGQRPRFDSAYGYNV